VCFPDLVWSSFGSWLRAIRAGIPPSEYVTAIALKNSFSDFLLGSAKYLIFRKFLLERIDIMKSKALRLVA